MRLWPMNCSSWGSRNYLNIDIPPIDWVSRLTFLPLLRNQGKVANVSPYFALFCPCHCCLAVFSQALANGLSVDDGHYAGGSWSSNSRPHLWRRTLQYWFSPTTPAVVYHALSCHMFCTKNPTYRAGADDPYGTGFYRLPSHQRHMD